MDANLVQVNDLMVFEVEHVAAAVSLWRGRLSECWGARFEAVAPVRRFVSRRGTPGFSGFRWSVTTGGHVGYESWLERDHLMVLDFDPEIVGIASQPFWLHWHDGRRRRRHAPDYWRILAVVATPVEGC